MTEPQRDTQRAIAAAEFVIDGRDLKRDMGAILTTLVTTLEGLVCRPCCLQPWTTIRRRQQPCLTRDWCPASRVASRAGVNPEPAMTDAKNHAPDEKRTYLPGMSCRCGGRLYVVEDGAKCELCGQQNIKITGSASARITIS